MHALIENGAVVRYPYGYWDLRRDNPGTSFPDSMTDESMQDFGVWRVYFSTQPTYDEASEVLVEETPVFSDADQRWTQVWSVRPLTADELAQRAQAVQNEIVSSTQQRLDDFAQTRNYDGVLSLCTYATSPNSKFRVEGQYGVEARDATWTKLYEILAEVEAGTRPMPTSYADIEPELPPLVWPV